MPVLPFWVSHWPVAGELLYLNHRDDVPLSQLRQVRPFEEHLSYILISLADQHRQV